MRWLLALLGLDDVCMAPCYTSYSSLFSLWTRRQIAGVQVRSSLIAPLCLLYVLERAHLGLVRIYRCKICSFRAYNVTCTCNNLAERTARASLTFFHEFGHTYKNLIHLRYFFLQEHPPPPPRTETVTPSSIIVIRDGVFRIGEKSVSADSKQPGVSSPSGP